MRKLANSIARDIASPAGKMGSRSLFPVVAVPRAFFGTFFRFERKYCPPRGGSPTARAGVGASFPQLGFPYGRVVLRSSFRPLPPSGHPGSRLSHRDRDDASTNALDTFLRVIIGTAHTAVRSACCLPSFF